MDQNNYSQDQSSPEHQPQPSDQPPPPTRVVNEPEPERDLYTWDAPSRLYKKRNREFYSTVAAIVLLVSIILLFAKEFLLIAVILALGFVVYALSAVEPEPVKHTLTNRGIRSSGKLYRWETLGRYWWEDKWKQDHVHIELPHQFPGKLLLLLGKGSKDTIESILNTYLIKEKPDPTFIDKAAKWLQEKVPLETD